MRGEQRFTFDEVAGLYDRARPRYPEPLVEDIIALSGVQPGGHVLEIGCGTGQASVAFARRGFTMICLEPGSNAARLARERLAPFPQVEVVTQTFEAWPAKPEAFDLVISAQALHWVAPEVRFVKAASVLRQGGALAVFGHDVVIEASSIREELAAAYARHAPSLTGSTTDWYAAEGPLRSLFAESRCFGPVAHRSHSWSHRYQAAEYLDLLRTYSDHRLLPAQQRKSLLAAVGQAIEAHGGGIGVRYEAHLHLAHR
jgi:SAM-dependent methyltransferase